MYVRRSLVVLGLALAVLAVDGCSVKAKVNVADLEAMFPAIQQLSVKMLTMDDDCQYFDYARGAFSSNLPDDTCGSANGFSPPSRSSFDDRASQDLATLQDGFSRLGIPIKEIIIERGADGSIGSGSFFEADGCVFYHYAPSWTTLPEAGKDVVAGIDPNWYKTDLCP